MKETGIIMSGNHPKLIIDGLKTMTRRTWGLEEINKCPDEWSVIEQPEHWSFYKHNEPDADGHFIPLNIKCPYGQVGDRLWVRETWVTGLLDDKKSPSQLDRDNTPIWYKADFPPNSAEHWRPSIFMPRWASRLTLEITGLRAERLQEISPPDIVAEGYDSFGIPSGVFWFKDLWDSLNAKRGYGWDFNHWVWPISFKEIKV